MPTYAYRARDAAGKPVKGTMDAAGKDELIAKLDKMGYMTTDVAEVRPGIRMESVFERFKRISTGDMVIFNVQLSNMINAGISILNSLSTLSKQIENRKLREAVGSVARSIEGGDTFSEALAKHPRIFSKLFVNMVKAGEVSGKLDTVLMRFADFSEAQAELRAQIRGALFYPVILLFAGIAVTLFMVTFVIPQFAEIFTKASIKLPLQTLILYKVGIGIKRFWHLIILLIALCWIGLAYYAGTVKGKLIFDRVKLRLPIVGPLFRKSAISRFARTLGTLVESGVPILQSLSITKEVVGNEVLGRVIDDVHSAVEKGEKLAEPLRVSEEFPPDTVQMISVGEETGNLDGMLNKIADFYDMAVGHTIKKLTTILEPVFLVVMGAMVGFVMASMLLPMFDMIKVLRR